MVTTLKVRVAVRRLPFSRSSIQTFRKLNGYDFIAFTSKNAKAFFIEVLRTYRITPPPRRLVVQVGPRAELLKLPVRGKRILFPRSDLAPYDIVRRLRARGATVRVVPLYTTRGVPLTSVQKKALLGGEIKRLYFKSPSGISGLLQQLRLKDQKAVRAIPAACIGSTTARAARKAGFKKVSVTGIL